MQTKSREKKSNTTGNLKRLLKVGSLYKIGIHAGAQNANTNTCPCVGGIRETKPTSSATSTQTSRPNLPHQSRSHKRTSSPRTTALTNASRTTLALTKMSDPPYLPHHRHARPAEPHHQPDCHQTNAPTPPTPSTPPTRSPSRTAPPARLPPNERAYTTYLTDSLITTLTPLAPC